MNGTVVGILSGAILAFAALQFGIGGFLLVALLMLVGAFVGRVVSGEVDLRAIADAVRGRRAS